jgi:hypothetical protein
MGTRLAGNAMTKSVVGAGLMSLLLFVVPNKSGKPLLCAPQPDFPLAPPVVEIVESEDENYTLPSGATNNSEDKGKPAGTMDDDFPSGSDHRDDDKDDSDDEGKPAGSMDDDFPSGSDHRDDKDGSDDKGKSAGSMDDDFPSGSDHRDDDKDDSDDEGKSAGSMDSAYVRCHSPQRVRKSDVWLFPDRQPDVSPSDIN